jgi:hypothetical protein
MDTPLNSPPFLGTKNEEEEEEGREEEEERGDKPPLHLAARFATGYDR